MSGDDSPIPCLHFHLYLPQPPWFIIFQMISLTFVHSFIVHSSFSPLPSPLSPPFSHCFWWHLVVLMSLGPCPGWRLLQSRAVPTGRGRSHWHSFESDYRMSKQVTDYIACLRLHFYLPSLLFHFSPQAFLQLPLCRRVLVVCHGLDFLLLLRRRRRRHCCCCC